MGEAEIRDFLNRQVRRAAVADAARIEEQARIFLRMGYELGELALVRRPRADLGWDEDVVPLSALAEYLGD